MAEGDLQTPTMLWDPSFLTWQALQVRTNSQMMLVSGDLSQGSNLIYGFDDTQRAELLDIINSL